MWVTVCLFTCAPNWWRIASSGCKIWANATCFCSSVVPQNLQNQALSREEAEAEQANSSVDQNENRQQDQVNFWVYCRRMCRFGIYEVDVKCVHCLDIILNVSNVYINIVLVQFVNSRLSNFNTMTLGKAGCNYSASFCGSTAIILLTVKFTILWNYLSWSLKWWGCSEVLTAILSLVFHHLICTF